MPLEMVRSGVEPKAIEAVIRLQGPRMSWNSPIEKIIQIATKDGQEETE